MTCDAIPDLEDIRATIIRYAWSVDSADYVAMAACFAVDGKLHVTSKMTLHGRQDISDTLGSRALARGHAKSGKKFQRHNVSNIQIELDGDTARARCYFTVFTEIGLDHLGRYEDKFVRIDGQWLIADRLCSLDAISRYSRFAPAVAGEAPFFDEPGALASAAPGEPRADPTTPRGFLPNP